MIRISIRIELFLCQMDITNWMLIEKSMKLITKKTNFGNDYYFDNEWNEAKCHNDDDDDVVDVFDFVNENANENVNDL